VGLDTDEVAAMLASDALTPEVRADEDEARALGVNGVPFFVFAGRYGVSGAQPPEVLLRVLDRTLEDCVPSTKVGEGAACGPEDCA
jgi:predicted DsbA family dithiol-disulfide isomerase